jgi:hypothetical protein
MARAACAAVSCGVQHDEASMGFMTSLQQLIFSSPSEIEMQLQQGAMGVSRISHAIRDWLSFALTTKCRTASLTMFCVHQCA